MLGHWPYYRPSHWRLFTTFFWLEILFLFLTIYGVLSLLLIAILMPETIPQKKSFHVAKILTDFQQILTHTDFVGGVICLGSLWSIMILFSIVAPFFIQNILHYSVVEFGHMALLMGLAWFLGNITSLLSINIDFKKKVNFCLKLMLANTFIMLVIALTVGINLTGLLVQTFILIYLGEIIFPNYFGRNVSWFPQNAAAANSLTGACMTVIASTCSAMGAALKAQTPTPLIIAYIIIILICIGVYYLTAGRNKKVIVEAVATNVYTD